jgi:hypothetical protein
MIPVLKMPGSTSETATPNDATSTRSTSESASSPNFEAWYQPLSGMTAARPAIDETITMRPRPRRRMPGSAHALTTAGATRFTSSWVLARAALTSSTAPTSE